MNTYNLLLILIILNTSNCFQFTTDGVQKDYCFKKKLFKEDKLMMSFVTIAEQEELINVDIKDHSGRIIYSESNKEDVSYTSNENLSPGVYSLCFYPNSNHAFQISFEYLSLKENKGIGGVAKDTEVKDLRFQMEEIRGIFNKFELNARKIVDRRVIHQDILSNFTKSLKSLTYLKLFIIALLSVLQIFIIRYFFGPDKRVSKLKTSDKPNNEIL